LKSELIANLVPDVCKNQVVILDEADYAIEKYAAYFDKKTSEPIGMISLKHAKQVFFLSATYDKFARHFLLKCFDIKEDCFASFKTVPQIVNNLGEDDTEKPFVNA